MKKTAVSLLFAGLLALPGIAGAIPPTTIIAFRTMYGVDGPFLGGTNPLRGIAGDDLPWESPQVTGSLTTKGHLKIEVQGLVFKDAPGVPADKVGINDEPDFHGVVSCLTEDEENNATPTRNVVTDPFFASRSGDSSIETDVELPNPCVAPVIFVTGDDPTKWFAVTGFEAE